MPLDTRVLSWLGSWIARGRHDGRPPVIGISGCQGSGKTTYAQEAARLWGAAHFSIDDLYRTKAERQNMAATLHPLFAVRGVPGTHDLALGRTVIEHLSAAGTGSQTPIPAFDKLADDRLPKEAWPVFNGRPGAILIDGWCVGATPLPIADLMTPINHLESTEDRDGHWRKAWNTALATHYRPWFDSFDACLYLAAPSFDVVVNWRTEQEAGLLGTSPDALPAERCDAIRRFVSYYEHLTRHMLAGGVVADATVRLGTDRSVLAIEE